MSLTREGLYQSRDMNFKSVCCMQFLNRLAGTKQGRNLLVYVESDGVGVWQLVWLH